MLIISAVGFLDAAYLTDKHFKHEAPTCTVLEGCDTVTGSDFATMFGIIPVALLGVFYYATIWFLASMALSKKEIAFDALKIVPIAGLVASVYFVYLQLFVIHAICLYCMGSATSSTLLFLLGIWLWKSEN